MKDYAVNCYPRSKQNKNSKRGILNLGLVLIICTVMFLLISNTVVSTGTIHMKKIKVKPGDSLWIIAKAHYSSKIDVRKKIYQIKKINNLTNANIQPGQIIEIPQNK
ncbi:LysM peptidoglycan-binding domain-containing protein [Selenihalanaerobacter shriftii]|uniref:LysM domain-containing protein n=1 Tax=Selenihalanaerobacter shriftii TaxID=142842 RepID=A0A1T4LZQ0_9FIRM|nr:LysM peptidoglycan-binding domain-containing protein [Selenihalanaerobacter shriftii]SJZ59988.1 LysM domain-containing protein [Selenihalanaerobacter shriftii]